MCHNPTMNEIRRSRSTAALITEIFEVEEDCVRVYNGSCWLRGKPRREGSAMPKLSRRDAGLILVAAGLLAPYSFAADGKPLAIKGYDPVAYFVVGTPLRGLPDFEHEWDEHRYRFVSAEHRELFKADPVRYAPQFGDYCAMALAMGELDEANPEYWLISDGKLYIFGKPAPMGPVLFQQDLAANVAKANQNRPLIQAR
jgi:hypothetical protein